MTATVVVLFVSSAGLGVTYYFARRAQIEAVQNELLQLARLAAARVDGDAHRRLDSADKELSPEYFRILAPLVELQKTAVDVFYVYTAIPDGDRVRYVLDTATVYRAPGDTEPYVRLMEEYTGTDWEFRQAVATHSLGVNAEPEREPERTYLSAFAPFYDSRGDYAGTVGVDMWVRALESRLSRLQGVVTAAAAGLVLVSLITGVGVHRLRTHAAASDVRDGQTLQALAEARDAAEQSSRAKSAFLATMSHELRTPLNAIVGYSDLIYEELVDKGETTLAADVQRVRTASHHLTDVISAILDYSKLEAGRVELQPAVLDVAELLRDQVELFRPAASAKGLTLAVHVAPGLGPVAADAVRVRQILMNLLDNALKFTERGGVTARLRPASSSARVVCTVHDTGVGIPADKLERLFKPFSQVDSSLTRAAGGTGLGLAISRGLAERMGGMLRVRSRPGRGTAFRLSLPVGIGTTDRAA